MLRGLLGGLAGTALMTGYQLAVRKARGEPLYVPVPRTWEEAPAPALVAKKAVDAVGRGRTITREDVPLVTNGMHLLYGLSWGVVYELVRRRLRLGVVQGAATLGLTLWAASYAELVPLGVYRPPWEYPPADVALDLSYHLVYGAGVAAAVAALERE